MLVRDIETALSHTDQWEWKHGLALHKGAIVHLCRRIEANTKKFQVLELGGGYSTLFWYALLKLDLLQVQVTTLEHHGAWVKELAVLLEGWGGGSIYNLSLKQVSEEQSESLFASPKESLGRWTTVGTAVPKELEDHYTIRNTFYDGLEQLSLPAQSIDVMIVDGPHGNGRSLAYPLFCNALKPDALVLIDDFDHYPFLPDLARVFHYEELYREAVGNKRWVLVRLQGMRD